MDDNLFKKSFTEYSKSVFKIENDLKFWRNFLTHSIEKYEIDNEYNREVFSAIFTIYNRPLEHNNTWLYTSELDHKIEIIDLKSFNDNFFDWIMSLSLVSVYNSVELLLLQIIRIRTFPTLKDPSLGRDEKNKLIQEIGNYLVTNDLKVIKKNNLFLLDFIKSECPNYSNFLKLKLNNDWDVNWESFYFFISTLRNIITHQGNVTTGNVNLLKSISKELFDTYFILFHFNGNSILKPKDESSFFNFLSLINDFSGNTTKYIADEIDLRFIGFRRC